MFGFQRRDKTDVATFRIPQRSLDALISATMSLSHELEALILDGRRRAAQRPGLGELRNADIFALIDRLKTVAGKVLTEMEDLEKASKEEGEVAFDAIEHARYVAPSANLLRVPDEAVNAAMDALDRCVTNAALIHWLMLAELDVVLQRWRVALATGIAEGRVQLKSLAMDLTKADL